MCHNKVVNGQYMSKHDNIRLDIYLDSILANVILSSVKGCSSKVNFTLSM